MSTDILTEVQQRLPELSRAERRVAEWLLQHPQKAVDMPLNEVAASAGVSDPSVIRFCRSVGTSGFRQFKGHLIAALQRPQSYLQPDIGPDDKPDDAIATVLESTIHTLADMRGLLSEMPFEPALEAMHQARQLVFVGLGASGCVAQDACHKFFRLSIPCTTALDGQTIVQQAAIAHERDVLIFISHTGNRADLIRGIELANARRAATIALAPVGSSLSRAASLTFDCRAKEDTSLFTPMSSRIAQLTLLDALQIALALTLGTEAEANLQRTKDALLK